MDDVTPHMQDDDKDGNIPEDKSKLLDILKARVDLLNQRGDIMGDLAEHDVVDIISHRKPGGVALVFNLADDRFRIS